MVSAVSLEKSPLSVTDQTTPLDSRTASLVLVALQLTSVSSYADAQPPVPKPHPFAEPEDTVSSEDESDAFTSWRDHHQVRSCETSIKGHFVGGLEVDGKLYFLTTTVLTGVRGGCRLGVVITDLGTQQLYLEFAVDQEYSKKDVINRILAAIT